VQDTVDFIISKTNFKEDIMPHVMKLTDDSIHTIFSMRDFLELVDQKMGYEARQFLEEWEAEIEEEKESDAYDCKAAEEELEKMEDHNRAILCNIREEAEALSEMLEADRLNRKKLQQSIRTIWKTVNTEL
jgi:hypothetical protein